MAYERRDIRGGAVETTLNGGITSGATSFTLASSTGWPDGGAGPFLVAIDRPVDGQTNASYEKILCASRTGNSVTVTTRGYDDTSAVAHSTGARVEHIFGDVDLDEANYTVAETVGKITGAGELLIGDGANSLAALDVKTSGRIIVGSGTSAASVAVSGDATLASSGALTIANNAVTNAKMADNSVDSAEIVAGAIDTAHIGASQITNALMADNSVDSAEIVAGSIDTAHIADAQVTEAKLAATVPLGRVGSAVRETDQTGITTEVDITSMTTTFTAVSGRYYKISAKVVAVDVTNPCNYEILLNVGGTNVDTSFYTSAGAVAGFNVSHPLLYLSNALSGSTTAKLRARRSAGTGTVTVSGSATVPMTLVVEDLGT